MLDSNKVMEFFNKCAATWDNDAVVDDAKINLILDNAKVKKGSKVLDVACGTGVLIPYLIKREVALVHAIDISPGMIAKAREKFENIKNVEFICADVMKADLDFDYDSIIIYNAFPHFPEPEKLIIYLSDLLALGGVLTVAHSMGREQINNHHRKKALDVSMNLMHIEQMMKIFSKNLFVTTVISEHSMYQLAGVRKN